MKLKSVRSPKVWYSGTRGLGNKRTSGDNPNNSIVEIGQNTKKGPGDLRRFIVKLQWKTIS